MSTTEAKKIPYGECILCLVYICPDLRKYIPVRLGNSGLKISKLVLGCMSYGTKRWQPWVLEEEEAIKHIKFA